MTAPSILPFDTGALYRALDARRTELGLSWQGVADQIWRLSSELNDRRRDHPISPATLSGMASRPRTSCQHALFMLRWLGRTPESFLTGAGGTGAGGTGAGGTGAGGTGAGGTGAGGGDERFALPLAGADRRLRWALKLLYACMDERRRQDGLTWPELAAVLGCTAHQLTGLRTAKFATNMDLAMRIVQWLGRPAADFVYPAKW